MKNLFQAVWTGVLGPMLQRPKRLQVAALCHRGQGAARRYLLITSRDTGRWIVPKGWPIRGLSSNETALQEAWEEAGVKKGQASTAPIGTYTYGKRQNTGWTIQVKTLVSSVSVGSGCLVSTGGESELLSRSVGGVCAFWGRTFSVGWAQCIFTRSTMGGV